MGLIDKWLDHRKEIKGMKYDYKEQKSEDKYSAMSVAYANGIDPKAAWANATSEMVQSVGETVSNVYGYGNKPGHSNPAGALAAASEDQSPGLVIGLFVLVFLFLTGRL